MSSFQTFTVTNDRLRRLYIGLTNNAIQEQPFWGRYKEHVARRHRVVHKGYVTTQAEAEQSLIVAREFVEHIKATLPLIPNPRVTVPIRPSWLPPDDDVPKSDPS